MAITVIATGLMGEGDEEENNYSDDYSSSSDSSLESSYNDYQQPPTSIFSRSYRDSLDTNKRSLPSTPQSNYNNISDDDDLPTFIKIRGRNKGN